MDNLQGRIIPDFPTFGICLIATFGFAFTFPTTTTVPTLPSDPCYQLGAAGGGNITKQIESLVSRTDELRSQAESVKSHMFETYNWQKAQIDHCNDVHIMNMTEINSTDNNGNEAAENGPAEQLQKHYRFLDLLLRYVNYIVSNGELLDQDPELEKLLTVSKTDMDSVKCTVLTALAKLEVDSEQIMEHPYSFRPGFESAGNLDVERYRACIVMNDCQILMGYLNQVYKDMLDTSD